ncbi:NUDIX hydrolase [Pilimelia anulata]|uniref:NUDIX hydrolase n=1 Tax=Pilimelia anulata TaxID=53371 RepID=A0A8J3FA83_9ACTN|nr:NUDIX hydrolase [Pilimelia anulata]GGJ99944.1 NUDIX hydrolase [Pilimelia anulata]
MNDEVPLYRRDPVAWRAHLAAGNATQPRKRVSADLLIRDPAGRILLVDPTYKPGWDLPGGRAEANEPPAAAARREVREELGLDVPLGRLLVVDWVAPHDPWDDLLAFIFDGGVPSAAVLAGLELGNGELAAYAFCDPAAAAERLRPHVWRRAAAALDALAGGPARYLQDGRVG